MYYRNELFYRLHAVPLDLRARLYHYACQLAQENQVVVTIAEDTCCLWVSLRSSNVAALSVYKEKLQDFVYPESSA